MTSQAKSEAKKLAKKKCRLLVFCLPVLVAIVAATSRTTWRNRSFYLVNTLGNLIKINIWHHTLRLSLTCLIIDDGGQLNNKYNYRFRSLVAEGRVS